MKRVHRLPGVADFGICVDDVSCPFCESANVEFDSMTGGAANELLMRCLACKSFFFTLKDATFLEVNTLQRSQSCRQPS